MAPADRAVEGTHHDKVHPDQIRIVASSFLVALAACFESDLILTAPARVLGRLAEVYGLRAVRTPILMEAFEVRQYCHARNQDEPPNRSNGRAAGRERVVQDVEIMVVAGS